MRLTDSLKVAKTIIILIGLILPWHAEATTVSPTTLSAWNEHVEHSKDELSKESDEQARFLWIDRQRHKIGKVRAGDILTADPRQGAVIAVPSGLIHHSLGTVFIPNVRSLDVIATLQDYDSYTELYQPSVIDYKLLGHTLNDFNYQLKFVQKAFGVKAGLLGEFRSTYSRLGTDSGYILTESTHLAELENPGEAEERVLPLSASHGYVERMFTIVRYRESGGGVFVEIDALTLSRDIPGSVRWLIGPFVKRFSRQEMTTTLQKLRNRVQATRAYESASNK